MKKIITAAFCICLMPVFCQTRDKELTFSAGPAWSNVKSDNVYSDPYADPRGTIFPFFNLGYTWNFTKSVGLSTGVGYSHFQNITSYSGYFRGTTLRKDRFGDEYYPLTAADYSVTRTINSLDVPICLRLGSDYSQKLSFFVDLGVRLNFLIGDKSVKNGTIAYKALYPHPDYNFVYLLVENEPGYGYTNLTYYNEKIEGGNTFGYGLMMNAGAKASLGEKAFFAVSFMGFRGLRDMSIVQQEEYMNPLQDKTALLPTRLMMFGMSATYGLKIY